MGHVGLGQTVSHGKSSYASTNDDHAQWLDIGIRSGHWIRELRGVWRAGALDEGISMCALSSRPDLGPDRKERYGLSTKESHIMESTNDTDEHERLCRELARMKKGMPPCRRQTRLRADLTDEYILDDPWRLEDDFQEDI